MPSGQNWVNFLYVNIAFAIYIAGVFYFNQLAVIKANWPLYRCNPMYMFLADDIEENFVYCIQSMQTNFMGYLLQPLTFITGSLTGMMGGFIGDIQNIRAMFNKIRVFFSSIIQSVFGVFLNLIIEFQRITIGIKDLIGKTIGIMVSLMYMIDGSIKTMNSTWNGPPGQLVRALGKCFYPYTHIKLKNNVIKYIKDIELGDVLEDGSIVNSIMKIDNLQYILINLSKDKNKAEEKLLNDKIIEFTKTEIIGDYTMNHSTPCIIPYNDGYLMNIRCVNYSINDNCLYCNIGTNEKCSKIITFNKRLELSKDFKIINKTIMIPDLTDNYIIGIEDVKPFKNFSNEIVFLGSSQHDYDSIGMNYGKYNDINNSNKIKPDFFTHNREKNWVFIPNEKNEIIYKWWPLTICNLNESVLKIDRIVHMPNIFKLVRGSSNGFLYKDEIWFITHFVSDENRRYYYQLFVVFDINMNLQRYSPPFNFSDKPIEFCLSIIVADDQVIIPYSVNDASAIVSIYEKKMIDNFINVIV